MMTEPRAWWIRMREFVRYMRERGHHKTWMHEGQRVTPIGSIMTTVTIANDNRKGDALA